MNYLGNVCVTLKPSARESAMVQNGKTFTLIYLSIKFLRNYKNYSVKISYFYFISLFFISLLCIEMNGFVYKMVMRESLSI